MKVKVTKAEEKAIERIQKAIKKLPKTLWLHGGKVSVMKYKKGNIATTPNGGIDGNYMIKSIEGIPSKEGDW